MSMNWTHGAEGLLQGKVKNTKETELSVLLIRYSIGNNFHFLNVGCMAHETIYKYMYELYKDENGVFENTFLKKVAIYDL